MAIPEVICCAYMAGYLDVEPCHQCMACVEEDRP